MIRPSHHLVCPVCRYAFTPDGSVFRCVKGHCFDMAKSGYINLLHGKKPKFPGDDSLMLQARRQFLESGAFDTLHEMFVAGIADMVPRDTVQGPAALVDIGCGEGYHLAQLLKSSTVQALGLYGIGFDLSKHAAKLTARRCPTAQVVVADIHRHIPLADQSTAIISNFFAPRNAAEFARILQPQGRLIIALPMQEHMIELRQKYDLLSIHPDKERKILQQFDSGFHLLGERVWKECLTLEEEQARNVIAMGPNARHMSTIRPPAQSVTMAIKMLFWEKKEKG